MNWFNNMTLKGKLLTGFIVVAVIAAVIGGVGIYNLKKISAADTRLYEKITVPLGELSDISTAFQRVRINLREATGETKPQERQKDIETIKKLRQEISEKSDIFEKTILTEEGRKMFADFKASREAYGKVIDKAIGLSEAGKYAEAGAFLGSDVDHYPVEHWLLGRSRIPADGWLPLTPLWEGAVEGGTGDWD